MILGQVQVDDDDVLRWLRYLVSCHFTSGGDVVYSIIRNSLLNNDITNMHLSCLAPGNLQ